MKHNIDQPSRQTIRNILVYGAGVLGSLYAGKLHQAGFEVTLLARGKRLIELNEQGLVLIEDSSTKLEHIPVRITDRLAPEDGYDLVLVVVRKNQLTSVLPALAANKGTPNVLFLVNNAQGPAELIQALGSERVLLGFPGAGGQRLDGIVRYKLTARSLQVTTIGERDGQKTERIEAIARMLEKAGFPVAISDQMDAWLKTHAVVVSPVANALYLAGGSNYRLARTRDGLLLMIRAVKEGLRALHALDVPITPVKYRLLEWIPEPLLLAVLRIGFATPQAELVLARHANAARDEMSVIDEEVRALARRSGVATPAMNALSCYLDPAFPTLPEGQARLPIEWRPIAAWVGALLFVTTLTGWLNTKTGKRK